MIGGRFREWFEAPSYEEGVGVDGVLQSLLCIKFFASFFDEESNNKNLRAAKRQPSTNTKTKLDLTNASWDFHKPWNAVANIRKLSDSSQIILHFFTLYIPFSTE